MNKHTLGPWISHVSMIDEESGNDILLIRSIEPLRGITSIESVSEEDEANARLIAAAPDLLEALKVVRGAIDPRCRLTLARVQAAIDKAEGQG